MITQFSENRYTVFDATVIVISYSKIPAITGQRGLLVLQRFQHIVNMLDRFFTTEQVNSIWQLWSVHFA